ncbi:MAG: hypothetical protein M1814_002766 [Vezdaea aestivalis]|nr:MAG: hypothetical protein M1814_002766 [Vezdaea aestivalis]
MTSTENRTRHIIIVGGGIIGCTTAYFLTRHPAFDPTIHKITLIEATSIAAGASGKAGGLLARWAYPKCLASLSFQLHASLAAEHDGASKWGYRKLNCGQLDAHTVDPVPSEPPSAKQSLHKHLDGSSKTDSISNLPKDLDWISPAVSPVYTSMAPSGHTAQVHPRLFTEAMASFASSAGMEIINGQVTRIERSADPRPVVEAVVYRPSSSISKEETLPADTVILTAGPWTPTIYPEAPITALRAHSVVIRPPKPVSAYALFTEIAVEGGPSVSPEIYARPDETIYACGEGDTEVELPATAGDVQVDLKRCEAIAEQVGRISEELRDREVLVKQACYLPQAEGGPLIGETDAKGLVLAAGHTCWGIQNAPATGKCVAELVMDGKVKSANIISLDARRFFGGRRG